MKKEESVPVQGIELSKEQSIPEENKFKRPQSSPKSKTSTQPKLIVNPNDLFHNDLSVIDKNKVNESTISNTSHEMNSEIKVSLNDP